MSYLDVQQSENLVVLSPCFCPNTNSLRLQNEKKKKKMSIFFIGDGSHLQMSAKTFNKNDKHRPQIMHLSRKEIEEMTTNLVLKYTINDL